MKSVLLGLVFCLGISGLVRAQQVQQVIVKGLVRDAVTNEPLPFVSIVVNEGPDGTASDIAGKFQVKNNGSVQALTFRYLGYEPQKLAVTGSEAFLNVSLKPNATSLREVVVRSGNNPAHRIIELASQNRERNDPAKLPQYTYRVYNKTTATLSEYQPDKKGFPQTRKFLSDSYFFLSESLADHAFMAPDLDNETVLASRISGWQDPQMAILATNSQEFSIYQEQITFFGKSFLSPLSKGSTRRYDFQLQDTAYSGTDTIFIISYKPLPGRNFDGLQGQLHITSNGWATENVIAESRNKHNLRNRLQQHYKKEGPKWVPEESNIEVNIMSPGGQLISVFSRSTFYNFNLEPGLLRRDFRAVTIKINEDAGQKSEAYWAYHRPDSLTAKETRTYQKVDSIYIRNGLDQGKVLEIIYTKQFPVGPLSLDLDRFFRFNQYENYRLGIGAHTNKKVSRLVSLGGYVGYGFRDKAWKYGSDLQFNVHKASGLKLKLTYAEDLAEAGGIALPFDEQTLLNSNYRHLAVKNMDKVTHQIALLTVRTLKYLDLQTGMQQENKRSTNGYGFEKSSDVLSSSFRFTEAVLGFRYAFREQIMQLFKTNVSLGTRYPVVWFRYSQGLKNVLNGEYAYQKFNARLRKNLRFKMLGSTTAVLDGGLVKGNIPYPNLYNGNGSAYWVYSTEWFQTMGMNEFLLDRYAALYLNHNLGQLLYKTEKFSPSLSVITNVGFGSLSNPQLHKNTDFKTMEKGYFESGLMVNNLVSYYGLYSLGAGVFYRYGAYQKPALKDNLAFRVSTAFNL